MADEVNFYLVLFDQACTHAAGGCGPANLIADCRQCHAPNDADPQILRMQEIAAPFTHWFSSSTTGGRALLGDFANAHGTNEDYGPIPASMISKSDPGQMAALITFAGFGTQPNSFDSATIEAQVNASAPGQPLLNMPAGRSDAWHAAYDAAIAGHFIAAPYHDVKVTDPAKLATMSTAYRQWISGASKELPDIRDVFLDDGLRDMGFRPQLGLDGRGLLVQLCQQCHNSSLDQTLSRALFNVEQLDQMSRAEKDLAISRILLGDDTRLKMPPVLFRTFTKEEGGLMITELKK